MSSFGGGGSSGPRGLLPVAPSLGDLLEARPRGLTEPETWALLYQAVQALQDLFLSDGAAGIPLITPSTLLLSSRGRVRLSPSPYRRLASPPPHLTAFLAPEYRPHRHCSDTDIEKMWIFGLGETLKRATLKSPTTSAVYCGELYHVLSSMTMPQPPSRASLMYLLDVISEYCKRRQQNRPFSHIVMDLHQEAMAALETTLYTWGNAPPAMPNLRPIRTAGGVTGNRSNEGASATSTLSIPRRWMGITRSQPVTEFQQPKLTREASTSMEDLTGGDYETIPALNQKRPKSMCLASDLDFNLLADDKFGNAGGGSASQKGGTMCTTQTRSKRDRVRGKRNPVQRAASRLYRAGSGTSEHKTPTLNKTDRECVGPEFVVRAALPSKQISYDDCKGSTRKTVTVIMLNGQKIDISCNPNTVTAGQLFELIIHKEHIEENFILGLSALIAGDFVFLPSDARICKAISGNQPATQTSAALTLYIRVRFFLPSLRGVRGLQARHLIYLQLRRSVLEHQLPCSCSDLVELGGLALQAEFGDFSTREHGTRDYFLLEHYVPETITSAVIDPSSLRKALTKAHVSRKGLDNEKSEEDFILLAQTLPHYGGHFYTAIWVTKDSVHKDVWLCISAQGINLYERGSSTPNGGPVVCESFEWRTIQTLCYSKHYLCILPHANKGKPSSKLKKYKLKMDNKKSYFAFRLASLHHQFFLRLRTEYVSLQSLSQQFGIPLKDMKNESNCLYKMETLAQPQGKHANGNEDFGSINAETEFKIDFRSSTRSSNRTSGPGNADKRNGNSGNLMNKRSKSVNELQALNAHGMSGIPLEEFQNKENENPLHINAPKGPSETATNFFIGSEFARLPVISSVSANNFPTQMSGGGLILDSSCLSGYPNTNVSTIWDKRRGVKMGVRAFGNNGRRFSRSMEAVNLLGGEDLLLDMGEMSLESVSLNCSSNSMSKLPSPQPENQNFSAAYILDSSIKSADEVFLPNLNESLSQSLLEKLNNISFAEERVLKNVTVLRNHAGSLGLQITEGSDGNVYVQSVVPGGPAHKTNLVYRGDQIVAVDGHNLLQCKYEKALEILKNTGKTVEFVLASNSDNLRMKSRAQIDLSDIKEAHLRTLNLETTMNRIQRNKDTSANTEYLDMSCPKNAGLEKHLTENPEKSNKSRPSVEVDYHKHIRYETEPEIDAEYMDMNEKNITGSTNSTFSSESPADRKAVVVNVIPKAVADIPPTSLISNEIPHIALPRSLGLGRKWRGPVKYPVTPVKHTIGTANSIKGNIADKNSSLGTHEDSFTLGTTSDDEQVFI